MAKKAVSKKAPAKKVAKKSAARKIPVKKAPAKKAKVDKAPEVEAVKAPEAPVAKKTKLPGGRPRCKSCGRMLVSMNEPHVNGVCGICAPPEKAQKSVVPAGK